jgi:RHS repeat-associated protein
MNVENTSVVVAIGDAYDPWGNDAWPPLNRPAWDYYRWNGAWGYLRFTNLGLYYVHGRWYSPDVGRWISPDQNGSYIYFDNDGINKHADVPPPRQNWPSECTPGLTNYDPRDLTCWLFREMKRNLDDYRLQVVKQINSTANARLIIGTSVTAIGIGLANPLLIGAGVVGDIGAYTAYQSARKQFSDLVADRKTWDFKHKIEEYLGPGITLCSNWRCGTDVEYSVPGNVHFGFVAREAGYVPPIVHVGAGHAEITDPAHDPKSPYFKESYTPWGKFSARLTPEGLVLNLGDDPQDHWAVQFGIRLYDKYADGRNLTYLAFQQELGIGLIGFAKRAPRPRPVEDHLASQWPYPLGFFDPTTGWLR